LAGSTRSVLASWRSASASGSEFRGSATPAASATIVRGITKICAIIRSSPDTRATAAIADARFAFPLGEVGSDVALAPLLCAGLIGWRSLVIAGEGKKLGL
jgi:hypothetical protein